MFALLCGFPMNVNNDSYKEFLTLLWFLLFETQISNDKLQ